MVSAQVCLCWMVCPSSRGLSPPLSACVPSSPTCVPVLDAASAFPRSCLPLPPTVFPHMCACVGWCVRLSPLVSLCFPHIVAHVSLRWKVCSPSRGLVSPLSPHIYTPPLIPHRVQMPPIAFIVPHCSHCLPTCVPVDGGLAFLRRACVGWCVHIPELLSRLVSQLVSHVSTHACLWRMRPPFRGLVPPCLPVLDAASVFPRSCPPLCPFLFPYLGWRVRVSEALSPFLFSFVGWCVCLPEVLSSLAPPCFPLSSRMCAPHVCLCCVTAFPRSCLPLSLFFSTCVPVLDGASAFPRSCLRLSPIVFPFVCLCLDGMTHCLPLYSLHMRLRWISEVLPPLVSHCLPTSAPVLDGVSAFPRSCLAWSSFLCPFVGWYARFPVLSPLVSYVSRCLQLSVFFSPHVSPPSRGLVSPCVPSCFPLLDGASAVPLLWIFPRTCPPCPPACLPACLPACQVVFPR